MSFIFNIINNKSPFIHGKHRDPNTKFLVKRTNASVTCEIRKKPV